MAFTFFFRDAPAIEAAVDALLPRIAGRQKVRIWDAGAAHGPEPYTLALLLAARMSRFGLRTIHILATDVDESGHFGEVVGDAAYPLGELERIPAAVLDRFFEPPCDGRRRLVAEIRDRVSYRRHDLLSLQPPGEGYALIVCKNVLLHFSPEARVEVLRMFAAALAPDGLLLVEPTQGIPEELAATFARISPHMPIYALTGEA